MTKIYGTGGTIAEQRYTYPAAEQVIWLHQDRITQSFNTTTKSGDRFELDDGEFNAEFEPLGAVLPQEDPAFDPDLDPMPNLRRKQGGGNASNPEYGCVVDGILDNSCNLANSHLSHGTGEVRPGSEVPWNLGIWVDYDGPTFAPDSSDAISIGTQTRFVFFQMPVASDNVIEGGDCPLGYVCRGRKLGSDEVDAIKQNIEEIMNANPDCATFIQGILSEAATPDNPLVSTKLDDVLDKVLSQGGIYSVDNLSVGGYAKGQIGNGTAFIETLSRRDSIPGQSKASNKQFARSQQLLTAQTVIAEVIHHSGKFTYDDIEMSLALARYSDIEPPDYGRRLPKEGQSVSAWVQSWSGWWHPKVQNHCSLTSIN